jgi:PRTRC genetic system ThiF family protein
MSATEFKHKLDLDLYQRLIRVCLVGAGGNGSQMLSGLARLHLSLKAVGHPYGFDVVVLDPDLVTEANVGRQLFSPSDIGQPKAHILVNRLNAFFGLDWRARASRFCMESIQHGTSDFIIGCVDTKASRRDIAEAVEWARCRYWLDLGNDAKVGQVILGEPPKAEKRLDFRLPTVTDLYPKILDPKAKEDDTPSCSLAGALLKQDLFINQAVSTFALNLLWSLFRQGGLNYHGAFINLETSTTTPLPIDEDVWDRFGFNFDPPPWRKVVKILREAKCMRRGRVKLECGHTVDADGRKKARCKLCKKEGRK